jgi:pimeloyl-ACP methyl ester carboxylesterase
VRRINNQGVELAFTDSGAGTPTLLIHGYPDSSVLWRHQIDPLTAAGLQVIAPDLRGFGESGKPDAVSDYAVGHAVGDMVAILDALDIERSHVVGHDWGAALAWGLAVQAPTLGIWSDRDAFVSERQMIESPLDRYERLEGAGHWMQLDAPERVTELILEHLC